MIEDRLSKKKDQTSVRFPIAVLFIFISLEYVFCVVVVFICEFFQRLILILYASHRSYLISSLITLLQMSVKQARIIIEFVTVSSFSPEFWPRLEIFWKNNRHFVLGCVFFASFAFETYFVKYRSFMSKCISKTFAKYLMITFRLTQKKRTQRSNGEKKIKTYPIETHV